MKPLAKYAWFLTLGVLAVAGQSTLGGPSLVTKLLLVLAAGLLVFQVWFTLAYDEVAREYGIWMISAGATRVESGSAVGWLLVPNGVIAVILLIAALGA
jgi:hypothetical protein